MSGLVRFFGAPLPLEPPPAEKSATRRDAPSDDGGDDQTGTAAAAAAGSTDANAQAAAATEAAASARRPGPLITAEEYGQSLVLPAEGELESSAQKNDSSPAVDNDETQDVVMAEVQDSPPADNAQTIKQSEEQKGKTDRLTAEQWSEQRRIALERFTMRRFIRSDGHVSSDGDNNENGSKEGTSSSSPKSKASSESSEESSLLLETSTAAGTPTSNLLASGGSPSSNAGSPVVVPAAPAAASASAAKSSGNNNEELPDSLDKTYEVPDSDIFNVPFLDTQEPLPPTSSKPPAEDDKGSLKKDNDDNIEEQIPESQEMLDTQPVDDDKLLPESQELLDTQDVTMGLGQNSADDDEEQEEEEEESPQLPDTQDQTCSPQQQETSEISSARKRGGRKKEATSSKKTKTKKLSKSERKKQKRKKDKHKIMHESETTGTANTIQDVNLRVATVNLGLCRVVAAYPLRKTKRVEWQTAAAGGGSGNDNGSPPYSEDTPATNNDDDQEVPTAKKMGELKMLSCPFDGFEDDGPLSSIYRSVLSLEVVEVVDEEKEEAHRAERRLFQRPFEAVGDDGKEDEGVNKANESSSSKQQPKRRIKIFLHGKYAGKVSRLLSEWKYRQLANGKACALAGTGREELLISLRNVPARCVLPYYAHTQTGMEVSLLDNEIGRLSRYCLCIGPKSHLLITSDDGRDAEKLRFDTCGSDGDGTGDLEMRMVMVRKAAAAIPVVESPTRAEVEQIQGQVRYKSTDEAVFSVTAFEQRSSEESAEPGPSQLALRYGEVVAKNEKKMQRLVDEVTGDERNNNEPTNAGQQQVRNEEAKEGEEAKEREETAGARARPSDGAAEGQEVQSRKRRRTSLRYRTMAELRPLFESICAKKRDMQSGNRPYHRIDDTVNVYAVALSSTAPYRTKRGDWMVTIHIIDESLPQTTIIDSTNENNGNANNTPEAASGAGGTVHIPSITLLVFSADKAKLPVVRCAGDVIRAHRVVVQEWSNEMQLLGRRNSSFYVVRPRDEKRMMENPTGHGGGWIETYTATNPSMLDDEDYMRMRDLWRWGRQRFMTNPTVNAKERFTIADMGGQDDQRIQAGIPAQKTVNGDLTAMIAAIIPVPADQISDMSPRAFLRLWDGTGPPSSDPMPVDSLFAREAVRDGDPPGSALTAICEIVPTLTGTDDDAASSFEAPKSLCGRVVNAVIWENSHWDLIRDDESGIRVGKFIRLRNVNDGCISSGLRCLMVHTKSSLTPLPEQTTEIKTLLTDHNARIVRKEPFNPQSGILPLARQEGDTAAPAEEAAEGVGAVATEGLFPPAAQQGPENVLPSQDQISSLGEVIGGPGANEPATYKARFSIVNTYPQVNAETGDGLKELCIDDANAPKKKAYEFVLKLCDRTDEIDAIVINDVALTFMSVTAGDVCKASSRGRRRHPEYYQGLKDLKLLLKEGAVWEGEIRAMIIQGEKYFVLQSLTNVSDAVGEV